MCEPVMSKTNFSKFVIALSLITVAGVNGVSQHQMLSVRGSSIRQIYLTLNPYEQTSKSPFWLRVTEQPDRQEATFVAGSFYTFETGSSLNGPWRSIMRIHLDDPDPIPTKNVVFVNGKISYVFLYDKLAVTQDAGHSWRIWELKEANPDWQPKKAIIRDVVLATDGSGTMLVEEFASSTEVGLYTHDFGGTWRTGDKKP